MNKKIIIGIMVILILTFFRYYTINATDNVPLLQLQNSVDEYNQIDIKLEVSNIKKVEGTLVYDSDVIRYTKIEENSNWTIELNEETMLFSATLKNEENINNKDEIKFKFSSKDNNSETETYFYLSDIAVIKNDDTSSNMDDLETNLKIEKIEYEPLNWDEVPSQNYWPAENDYIEPIINYPDNGTEAGDVSASELSNDTNNTSQDAGNEEVVEDGYILLENGEVAELEEGLDMENIADEIKNSSKDDLANSKLPQTGVIGMTLGGIFIAILSGIAVISFKKAKEKNK